MDRPMCALPRPFRATKGEQPRVLPLAHSDCERERVVQVTFLRELVTPTTSASCGKLGELGTSQGFLIRHILGIGRWCIAHVLKREGYDSDSTHYLHSCRRHHNRAVTGLWLASLHDGKRGTCQISQVASYLGRHQPLLEIRDSARAFATLTCGRARAFPATRIGGRGPAFPTASTHGRAGALPPTRAK